MRALAVLILAPAFALGAVAGAVGLVGDIGPTQKADSIVWAERVFVSRHDLAKWLGARGVDYDVWAQRHPSAAGVFDKQSARTMAATSRLAEESRRRTRRGHALLAALIAGLALAMLLAVYAVRSRIAGYSRSHRRRRPAPRAFPVRARWHLDIHRPVLLPATALAATRRRALSLSDPRETLIWLRLRHVLPRIAFYGISVLLAVALGASVAIYLQ